MTSIDENETERLIRLEEVIKMTGMSRSSIYNYMRLSRFPAPVQISERCVAWVASEIEAWIRQRIADRRPM